MITTIVTAEKMQFTLGIISKEEYGFISNIAGQKQKEAIDEYIGCFVSAIAGTNEEYKNPIILQFTFNDNKTKDIIYCIGEGALPIGMMEEIGLAVVKEALKSESVKWESVSDNNFKMIKRHKNVNNENHRRTTYR